MPTTLQPLPLPIGSNPAAPQAGSAIKLTIAGKPRRSAGVYGSAPAGGDGGDDDTMLARIEKLEAGMDRLSDTAHRIDANVAKLSGLLEAKLPELATRTDVARLEGAQVRLEDSLASLRTELDIRLPSLATKLELAEKPNKAWLMTAAATFVGMVTLGVAIGALIGPVFGQLLKL